MDKKAEANMWWVIIGAVLAIVVMVVLLTFFGRGTETVASGLSECESKLGQCVPEKTCQGTVTGIFECQEDQECCFSVRKQVLT